MTSWWLSTEKMTVCVDIDENNIIINAAPIVKRFIGQPSKNLGNWLRKQPGFRMEKLS